MILLIGLFYIYIYIYIYIYLLYIKIYKYFKNDTYIIIHLISLNTFKLKWMIILILNIF